MVRRPRWRAAATERGMVVTVGHWIVWSAGVSFKERIDVKKCVFVNISIVACSLMCICIRDDKIFHVFLDKAPAINGNTQE